MWSENRHVDRIQNFAGTPASVLNRRTRKRDGNTERARERLVGVNIHFITTDERADNIFRRSLRPPSNLKSNFYPLRHVPLLVSPRYASPPLEISRKRVANRPLFSVSSAHQPLVSAATTFATRASISFTNGPVISHNFCNILNRVSRFLISTRWDCIVRPTLPLVCSRLRTIDARRESITRQLASAPVPLRKCNASTVTRSTGQFQATNRMAPAPRSFDKTGIRIGAVRDGTLSGPFLCLSRD